MPANYAQYDENFDKNKTKMKKLNSSKLQLIAYVKGVIMKESKNHFCWKKKYLYLSKCQNSSLNVIKIWWW